MASLIEVRSGPVTADRSANGLSKSQWRELVEKRKQFVRLKFGNDCTNIVKFYNEAAFMWEELGYSGVDDMMLNGYGVAEIDYIYAIDYVTRNEGAVVGLAAAIALGRKLEAQEVQSHNATVNQSQPDLEGQGRPKKGYVHNLFDGTKGTASTYLQRRMARDAPDVLQDLIDGKYRTTLEAARAAGIAPPKRKRLSVYEDDPEDAGRYLAERVDDEWMAAMLKSYQEHVQ